jgi:predicted metal-binding membrane protein
VTTTATTADTPRVGYSALERRATLATAGALLALAGAAWWLTVRRSAGMTDMVQGLAQVGGGASFDMTTPVFLAMWVTMMVAMMFPTIAPIVLLHRMVVRRHGGGALPTVTFVGGYLVVWTIAGLVPLGLLLGFRDISAGSTWVARVCGAVVLVAGAYQFSRWKQACLRACRTPLTFLSTHDFGHGLIGTLRAGMSHGAYCLGCCWALMAVLFTVGLMNLAWMAALAIVFLAEKNWKHGVVLTKLVGAATVALGLAVLVHPEILSSVASTAVSPMMPM